MISAVLFVSFVVMLLLNVPIVLSLGGSALIAMLYGGLPLSVLPVNVYAGISKFVLLAIPFFVLAGNIMEKGGISQRLISFVDSMVGHKKGGLAIVCVVVCCFFAAISGSGPATVAALGVILIPAMTKAGYGAGFSSALMASAGSIGIIIPPSISFVVYGAIAGVSISKLFIAGIIPGCMMGAALIIVVLIISSKKTLEEKPKASAKERLQSFKDAFWGLLMPLIILGGIYGGVFTPTEAAAVSVVYGLFTGLFIYKEIKLKDLVYILISSAKQSAGIMIVIACASLFAWVCTTEGIAAMASELLLRISGNKYGFLLIVNILLLIAGCFIDANSAMYIFVPIMLPVALKLGYDPIAFGVMMTMNLAIGLVTPPVGLDLFVACQISKISLSEISKHVMPLIVVSLVVLFLITYFPQITLFLVK
ncbi:hypothetical protein AGMMS50276_04570 [Synergistales bacterium]|nr:hypothetical protein AGMMS50276_04570 [Synergistales bacterium]